VRACPPAEPDHHEETRARPLYRDFATVEEIDAQYDIEVMALPRNHFDILDDLADPDGALARAVVRLAGV
jgi:hypothetical protein